MRVVGATTYYVAGCNGYMYGCYRAQRTVSAGLGTTNIMWLGPSAQYAQEAVERGSGYPRIQLSCSITYLKYGQ